MRETEVGGRGSIINIISIFQEKNLRLGEIRPQVTKLINSKALNLFPLSPSLELFYHTTQALSDFSGSLASWVPLY